MMLIVSVKCELFSAHRRRLRCLWAKLVIFIIITSITSPETAQLVTFRSLWPVYTCSSDWWRRRPVHAGYLMASCPVVQNKASPKVVDQCDRYLCNMRWTLYPEYLWVFSECLFSQWMTAVRFKHTLEPVLIVPLSRVAVESINLPLSSVPNRNFFPSDRWNEYFKHFSYFMSLLHNVFTHGPVAFFYV